MLEAAVVVVAEQSLMAIEMEMSAWVVLVQNVHQMIVMAVVKVLVVAHHKLWSARQLGRHRAWLSAVRPREQTWPQQDQHRHRMEQRHESSLLALHLWRVDL